MRSEGHIALIGLGAAGAALAVELAARGAHDLVVHDRDPTIAAAIAAQGGIRHDGLVGRGTLPVRTAATAAACLVGAKLAIVSVTADGHEAVGRVLGAALPIDLPVLLHTGYVGGARVFAQGLAAGGMRGKPLLGETINTLHLSGAQGPADVFIKGRKAWLEASALEPAETSRLLAAYASWLPELKAGRSTLETGLNNPNPVGHVPALVGNLGLLDRNLGEATEGVLHFDELRSPAVQALCDALEAERISLLTALGLVPLPVAEFSRRAYPPGARLTEGVPRFGTKLLARFFAEDVPAALVPMESLARLAGVATPVTTALITLASTGCGRDLRAIGRTVEALGRDWVDGELQRAASTKRPAG